MSSEKGVHVNFGLAVMPLLNDHTVQWRAFYLGLGCLAMLCNPSKWKGAEQAGCFLTFELSVSIDFVQAFCQWFLEVFINKHLKEVIDQLHASRNLLDEDLYILSQQEKQPNRLELQYSEQSM